MTDYSDQYWGVVDALGKLGSDMHEGGHLKTRPTIPARQEEHHRMSQQGIPVADIAKITGTPLRTVERDLSKARQSGGQPGEKIEENQQETRQSGGSEAAKPTKAEKRAEREIELAAKQTALPSKRYGVILADPEWRFEPYSRDTGMDRAADNHYPTSATEVIMERDIASIAADDCVLFLWATVPMLLDALKVMSAWGFQYKSQMVWDKVIIGTGYWFRNRHELLLVGVKGDIPAPAMGEQYPSVMQINGPTVDALGRGHHSEKPQHFLEMIEQYFPTLPKIELNRRGPARLGWDAWGNETELQAAE